jgi:hypothetical protein
LSWNEAAEKAVTELTGLDIFVSNKDICKMKMAQKLSI